LVALCSHSFAQQPPSPPPTAITAPPSDARIAPDKWDVDRVRCSDLVRADDDDRAAAAMFYFGYLAAKAGIHVVDFSRISDNIAKVMQLCKAEPWADAAPGVSPSPPSRSISHWRQRG
jgi:hypothetical protein